MRQRRNLRRLLLFAGGNDLVLAVFGSVQKFVKAKGLYFGLVPSPQTYFFSSFIYHNHWGAFTVLMVALCLGLVAHYARRSERDFWHSPAPSGPTVDSSSASCHDPLLMVAGKAAAGTGAKH